MVVSREPFNVRFFLLVKRDIPYEVSAISGFKQDSLKISKVANAFCNLHQGQLGSQDSTSLFGHIKLTRIDGLPNIPLCTGGDLLFFVLCVGVCILNLHTTLVALDLFAFVVWAVLGCFLSVGSGFVPHSQHGCYVGVCGCECGSMWVNTFLCALRVFAGSMISHSKTKMAPGKGFEPLRARSPPATSPLIWRPFDFRSRGWRDNHSATPAPATNIGVDP